MSRLSSERIRLLKLEVSGESIRFSICTSKLKIKPNNCILVGETIIKVWKHIMYMQYCLQN